MGTGHEAPTGGLAEAVDAGGEEGVANGGVTLAARSARVTSNNFLLPANVFLVTLSGFQTTAAVEGWRAAFIPGAGLLVSLTWFSIMTSYKHLNTAKFKVIHQLEGH